MSNSPKVNILLSTYNGESYLATQLDSLLAQTYDNIEIFIRDDGSTDSTLQIISSYQEKSSLTNSHPITLLPNPGKDNLGYMQSFWTLLRTSSPADYYAFCDQDDFWFPNKIELGVKSLSSRDSKLPLLYSSSYEYCDENMNFTGNPVLMATPVTFKDVMFYTPAFGFTIMINNTLKELALSAGSLTNIPHDGWCQKIAASMGEFIYDSTKCAKYRRHSQTVTYANSNKLQLIAMWFKNDILGAGLDEYHFILKRFYEEYGTRLNKESHKCVTTFMAQKLTLGLYLKRLFYPKRLRPSLGGELALRLCFLLNR